MDLCHGDNAMILFCLSCLFPVAVLKICKTYYNNHMFSCPQFYHACDGDRKYIYCMMPYRVLSHCDFFGAILSVWVTIVTMAKLLSTARSFLYTLGALIIAIGVTWDKHSLPAFLVPASIALVIMGTSWVSNAFFTTYSICLYCIYTCIGQTNG